MKQMKFIVTPTTSLLVQRKLFSMGYSWEGSQKLRNVEDEFLFALKTGEIRSSRNREVLALSSLVVMNTDQFIASMPSKLKQGDEVMVRNNNQEWIKKKFMCKYGQLFICMDIHKHTVKTYDKMKRIEKPKTLKEFINTTYNTNYTHNNILGLTQDQLIEAVGRYKEYVDKF